MGANVAGVEVSTGRGNSEIGIGYVNGTDLSGIDFGSIRVAELEYNLFYASYKWFALHGLYLKANYGIYRVNEHIGMSRLMYLGVQSGGIYLDVEKSYMSAALGFSIDVYKNYFVGAEAFEYMFKFGGNDGVALGLPEGVRQDQANELYSKALTFGKKSFNIEPKITFGFI